MSRKNVWIKIDIEVKQGKLLMDVSNAISNIVMPLDYIGDQIHEQNKNYNN
ncbi:hypothetical protein D3C85_1493320 [compost metagenome]